MIIKTHEGMGDITDTIGSFQSWGVQDYVIVGLGLWVLYSVFSTTSRTYQSVSSKVSRVKGRSQKRKKLEQELKEL